jgi:choline monooxygenase
VSTAAPPESPITPLRAALVEVLQPIEQARGLPNAVYTSETLFTLERDRLIGPTWAGLLFTDSIPLQPYAQPVDFMGLPLLVTRDRTGVLRVFHNVCSHRGMKLVDAAADSHGVLTCRYHAWSYALDGTLKATPHIGGVDQHQCPAFDSSQHGLRPIRSATCLGVLFINLSGDAPDFEEHVAPLRQHIAPLTGIKQGFPPVVADPDSGFTLTVHANWKLAVENYLEAYHLPTIHPALNRYSPLKDHYHFVNAEHFAGQGSRAYQPSITTAAALPLFKRWPAERRHMAEYPTLYPNVLLGFQADHVFVMLLTPNSSTTTTETVRIYYCGEGAKAPIYQDLRTAIQKGWRLVFTEDVMVVEGMQAGRASIGYRGGTFSPMMDIPTHHFHQWVARQLLQ